VKARGFFARAAAGISMSAGLFMVRSFVLREPPKRSDGAGVTFDGPCSPGSDDHYRALRKERRVPARSVVFVVAIPTA
jgi:hypothetical protein